jgi:small subunit ribosomal protein S20
MANTSSAKKAIRKQEKQYVKNLRRKREYRDQRKAVLTAIEADDKAAAQTALSAFNKAIDKAAKHNGPLHKNTAARYKSRLAYKVNQSFTA